MDLKENLVQQVDLQDLKASQELGEQLDHIKGDIGPAGPRSGGVTYTRWGKSSCPNITGTELVYSGRTGGSHYQHGGAANYLCMPTDP